MVSLSLVNQFYTVGSLRNSDVSAAYRVKNRLVDATPVAGEKISLASAISARDQVSSHEQYGRKR